MISPPGLQEQVWIKTRDLSYGYPTRVGATVLEGIDLQVHAGRYLLIAGASGSGKSTLVRTFNGLIPNFYGGTLGGSVEVDGRSTRLHSVADLFDKVGLVFQNCQAQLFNRTLEAEMAFGLESLGMQRMQMAARIRATAAELAIAHLLPRDPRLLSGGEQQLAAIAAVLVLQPRVIVLDEPLANLDGRHARRLRGLLRQLRARGCGVVVCEHRMAPTLPDADHMVVLQRGRKALDGTPDEVLAAGRCADCGIELPAAVLEGRRLNLRPLPLSIGELIARMPADALQGGPLAGSRETGMRPDSRPLTSAAAAEVGETVLRLEGVNYARAGRAIVSDLGFDLRAGQCAALVGENGAGKTTTLKLIAGLLRPTAGRIIIKGRDASGIAAWQRARTIGTAFQNPDNQFFKLTVREELMVGPKVLDCFDSRWIDELVALFELEPLLSRAPFKLSGGEKKRVAFAAALAVKPAILALDEPTAGQDAFFRRALAQALLRLRGEGTAVLIITHALNFAESVADRWLVMAGGRLLADGLPAQLMADPDLMSRAGLEPTEAFQWNRLTPTSVQDPI